MTDTETNSPATDQPVQHFDVLIVGAGISGIGGAYHLQQQCPGKSFAILEAKADFGGTWRTHTYPGIRSDSDLFTFGYRFKPWTGPPIATGEQILTYVGEVIEDNDLGQHIRYGHHILSATWSSQSKRWTIVADAGDSGEVQFSANFLWMCQGYYRHSEGYTPRWEGTETFKGKIIHPQNWPDDLDYSGKEIVVIGSGATAATLIPAIAAESAHVTMLQRSPTYFATGRNANEVADMLRELDIPDEWTHEIVRRKVLHDQQIIVEMSRDYPDLVKEELFNGLREYLGDDYDIDTHFSPSYRPWQQRIAFIPDGDLLKSIADGQATVVTDHIEKFTTDGILLKSGRTLRADIVVTATGFNLSVLGDIAFTIDGVPLDFSETVTYQGTMFTGVPNMAWVFGYFRASWTLRADLIADFVCRLLQLMDTKGTSMVTPMLRAEDDEMKLLPWVEPENFNPGYLKRGMHLMPRQGDRAPWQHSQDYSKEKVELPAANLEDGALVFK